MTDPKIILVVGSTGSGKTTIVERLIEDVGKDNSERVPGDMFYKDRSNIPPEHRDRINYDDPDAIDWYTIIHSIMTLKEGKDALIPHYDFPTHTVVKGEERTAKPRSVIFVDGIMVAWHAKMRELADFIIFVQTELDICLKRRAERDTAAIDKGGRGRTYESVMEQWDQVREMWMVHFAPTAHYADIIIPNGGYNEKGMKILSAAIKSLCLNS